MQPQSSKTFSEDHLHQLGNLCLLTEPSNKGLRNLPFDNFEKQQQLAQSEFWATRALAQGNYFGAEKRAWASFSSRDSLSEEDIEERTQEIIAFLRQQLTS